MHLSEESLARRYQVSRTPVRAALKLLAGEDFIESRPNSGYYVKEIPEGTAPPLLQASTHDGRRPAHPADRGSRRARTIPDGFTDRDLQQRYGVPAACWPRHWCA